MTSSPTPPPLLTDSTLLNKGSSQRFVTSQWLSRNVRTGPLALATPSKRALTSPMGGVCMKGAKEGGEEGRVGTKPCLLGSRISFTFGIEVSSCPSMAAKSQDHNTLPHMSYLYYHLDTHNRKYMSIATYRHGTYKMFCVSSQQQAQC